MSTRPDDHRPPDDILPLGTFAAWAAGLVVFAYVYVTIMAYCLPSVFGP